MTGGIPILAEDVGVVRDGRTILDLPRLAIAASERLAIVGGNGAGKTTLLETLALLSTPARGTVSVGGLVPSTDKDRVRARRRMGFVGSSPDLLDATVARNIALPLRIRGASRAEALDRARRWANRLGVDGLLDRRAASLSAGEAARTSLARALAAEPDVLFLDEPFASLDEPTRDEFLRDLARVLPVGDNTSGATVVFVTHDRREATLIANRVVVLERGRIAQEGAPERLLEHPHTRAAARWAGFDNIIDGRLVEREGPHRRVEIAPGVIIEGVGKAPEGLNVAVCFRAEAVAITTNDRDVPASIRNRFTATVQSLSAGGGGTALAALSVGGAVVQASVTAESATALGVTPGARVVAAVKTTAVHVVE